MIDELLNHVTKLSKRIEVENAYISLMLNRDDIYVFTSASEIMNHLRKYRQSNGLSQEDMVAGTNIQQVSFSRYERGEIEPTFSILRKLCNTRKHELVMMVFPK